MRRAIPYPVKDLRGSGPQRRFRRGNLPQIAMPLGGIGAGCICLNGYGGLQDYAIRNRPATSAMPDRNTTMEAAFAILHVKGDGGVTRLVEGPLPVEKVYNLGLKGHGFRESGYEGLPRFERRSFKGESARLLESEGPKYQYGSACISDGVIGAWKARMYGIETPLRSEHVRKALKSIFAYNWRRSLQEHANPQRPGFAIGREPGLLLCSWPHGGKPTLPFVYSDKVWNGIEYQVASHLIAEGFVREGLTIVLGAPTI